MYSCRGDLYLTKFFTKRRTSVIFKQSEWMHFKQNTRMFSLLLSVLIVLVCYSSRRHIGVCKVKHSSEIMFGDLHVKNSLLLASGVLMI
jgi:hypothetical protein